MKDVIFWWFYNISEPFSRFAEQYATVMSICVFLIATTLSVLMLSRSHPFTVVMAMSVGIGAVALITYFPIIMFFPFVILTLGGATAFIGICYMLHASLQGKPE